jgi:hypothetical protein
MATILSKGQPGPIFIAIANAMGKETGKDTETRQTDRQTEERNSQVKRLNRIKSKHNSVERSQRRHSKNIPGPQWGGGGVGFFGEALP